MSQGPFCPNLTKKVQKEVSQMANHILPVIYRYAIMCFKCKLYGTIRCRHLLYLH